MKCGIICEGIRGSVEKRNNATHSIHSTACLVWIFIIGNIFRVNTAGLLL